MIDQGQMQARKERRSSRCLLTPLEVLSLILGAAASRRILGTVIGIETLSIGRCIRSNGDTLLISCSRLWTWTYSGTIALENGCCTSNPTRSGRRNWEAEQRGFEAFHDLGHESEVQSLESIAWQVVIGVAKKCGVCDHQRRQPRIPK